LKNFIHLNNSLAFSRDIQPEQGFIFTRLLPLRQLEMRKLLFPMGICLNVAYKTARLLITLIGNF